MEDISNIEQAVDAMFPSTPKKRHSMMKRTKILVLAVVLVIAIPLVSATLLTYINEANVTANVTQAVKMDGRNFDEPINAEFNITGGCTYCIPHTITNDACDEGIWLDFVHTGLPDLQGITVTMNSNEQQLPYECIDLPDVAVGINANDGADSYFDVILSEVPDGYTVANGEYNAWCVDEEDHMIRNIIHPFTLYVACDPANPYPDSDWSKVCWIINNKPDNLTMNQIQTAIWYFIDGGYSGQDAAIWWLINTANVQGVNYVPAAGELTCVVCYTDVAQNPGTQIIFIEVTMPACSGQCGKPMETPFYLGPGDSIEFCLCYDFNILIQGGQYHINSKLMPVTQQV
jgi:hypothetical protein